MHYQPPDDDHDAVRRQVYLANGLPLPEAEPSHQPELLAEWANPLARQVAAALEETKEFKWARRQMAQARGF
jgi:hypothetical protein